MDETSVSVEGRRCFKEGTVRPKRLEIGAPSGVRPVASILETRTEFFPVPSPPLPTLTTQGTPPHPERKVTSQESTGAPRATSFTLQ